MARDDQSASRPNIQAKPGRSLSPDVRNPATRPVPSIGLVASPLSTPTFAHASAVSSRSSGLSTESVRSWSAR